MRSLSNVLATVAPDWLKPQVQPEWVTRSAERIEDPRLPKDQAAREVLSARIGADGSTLRDSIERAGTQPEWAWLKTLPAVRTLEQTWAQQYRQVDGPAQRLTPNERLPVGEWRRAPYDEDVRFGKKRDFAWIGYKLPVTECCDDDLPHRSTDVQTAPAIEQDHHALDTIQADLAAKEVLPARQLVDAGSSSAKRILASRDTHGIDLVGPVHVDPSWQAPTPGALDVAQFQIAWQREHVTWPHGQRRVAWCRGKDAKGESVVQIVFPQHICQAGPVRRRCPDARSTGRSMTLRFPQARHELLQAARVRQPTGAFKDL